MKVLIDGKEVKFENDVKIIYDLEDSECPRAVEHPDQIHLIFTEEGLIGDIFQEGANEPIETFALEAYDMATELPFH